VSNLMLFRLDDDGRDVELRGSTVALEVELQRRIEAGMESILGIRFLASEYATGPWHRGRIDTLGLDENNTPVVIEFTDRKLQRPLAGTVLSRVAGGAPRGVRVARDGAAGRGRRTDC
jgi:RecB family endonuclease NucS